MDHAVHNAVDYLGRHPDVLQEKLTARVKSVLRRHCAELLWPLLTSGDSSQRLSAPVAQRQTARPPRVLRTHLHAYACRIYVTAFRASIGLCI